MRNLENLRKWARENYKKKKNDPEYKKAKQKQAKIYYQTHKEQVLEKCKEYRERTKDRYNEYRRNYRKENPKGIYRVIKEGILKRHKPVDFLEITPEEFTDWYNNQEKICYYCGRSIKEVQQSNDAFNKKIYRLTIDRKNNDIGYTKNNICLCCYRCNSIKSDYFTEEEMLKIGQIIKEKHNV